MMEESTGFVDAGSLAENLSAQFGVALEGRTEPEGDSVAILIRAADIPTPNGFSIKLSLGWRSLCAAFYPDTYAGHLIRTMGSASAMDKQHFSRIVDAFTILDNRISMRINDAVVRDPAALPEAPWTRFELTSLRMIAATELEANEVMASSVQVASSCLAAVLALLPLEEHSASVALFEGGLPEGAKIRVEVNKYERSPVNRAACIAIHGAKCYVCGFEFHVKYGAIGYGFIEVHHRIPVSRMGAAYVVDPASDLIPLCSNCHSMVHRHDPPMEVEALRNLLAGR